MSAMDLHMHMGGGAPSTSPPASSNVNAPFTPATIPCCECGTLIHPNPANTCINCLKSKVDITEGITKQVTLFWCRGCGRYQRPPYVAVELESREMLALCLQKIKGLNKEVKLVDASFIWTEPHSRRIKVKLTIQKEIYHGAILQQQFIVEFFVQNQQCPECQKSYTEHTWTAVVQIRQQVSHKKTMLYLEQMLLKHNVCAKAQSIKEQPGGMDIYWGSKSAALHLIEFLKSVVPVKTSSSKKLISQDDNSNVFNYKYAYHAEIAPVCKDDLVCLEPKLASMLGGVSQLMLCTRVTSALHLLDPCTLKMVEVSAGTFFHHKFRSQLTAKQMVEYVILDIEKIDTARKESDTGSVDMRSFNKQRFVANNKMCLAIATVARSSDIGKNDLTFEAQTHLGHMLKPGDTAMGYDMSKANLNDDISLSRRSNSFPPLILVRKSYPKRHRSSRRVFELKSLPKEEGDGAPLKKTDLARTEAEMEEFLNEIEEDPEMQGKVNLYRRKDRVVQSSRAGVGAAASSGDAQMDEAEDDDEDDDEEFPQIDMDALMDDMGAITIGEFDPDSGKPDSDIDDMPTQPPSAAASSSSASKGRKGRK